MFALVDCNSFYCSCERVFNPALLNRPIIVLSNNDGCVISRNNEAKVLGIPMGAPAHQVKDIIEKNSVAVFSSNYALYGDMSARVMDVLAQFTPELEVYSIDEAFLSLHGFEHYDLHAYGMEIKVITTQYTGVPVSIGIAATKTLAKLANKLAKKIPAHKGVYVLDTEETVEEALKICAIEDVWGIGRQYAKKLYLMGIKTAYHFIQLPAGWVHKHMSIVGLRMWEELRGKPCYNIELAIPSKKNICTSRSFGKMLNRYDDIEEAVANHAASCAEKLRRQNACASVLTVFIATNPFRPDTPQYANAVSLTLPHPSNHTPELIAHAKAGLKQVFRQGYFYKKVGVIVMEIKPENMLQMHMFRNHTVDEKQRTLMTVVDHLNKVYGRNTVKSAAQGQGCRAWKLRQEQLSPHYTTQLKDIVVIRRVA